jgi:hypothetical protein
VVAAQDIAAHLARYGRSSAHRGTGSTPAGEHPTGPTGDRVTHPTGRPGGTPLGQPTRIGPDQDAEVRRSLERENSAAAILADRGHLIQQNPTPAEVAQARSATGDTGRPTSRPDYLLDGRVFDCYSPKERTSVRNIWTAVREKVEDNQTQRVVVNLEDWRGELPALRSQFGDWPVENLQEVKIITPAGEIVQIIPTSDQD